MGFFEFRFVVDRQLIADGFFGISQVQSIADDDWVIPGLAIHRRNLGQFGVFFRGCSKQYQFPLLADHHDQIRVGQ